MIIKYFSWIREHVGKSEENFDLPSNVTTINELIDHLNSFKQSIQTRFCQKRPYKNSCKQKLFSI